MQYIWSIYRTPETILLLISLKRYVSYPKDQYLTKVSLILRGGIVILGLGT